MPEQLDLNELRARVLQNQQRGQRDQNVPDSESIFITPEGRIQVGNANSSSGTNADRGTRTGSKLPPTVFA